MLDLKHIKVGDRIRVTREGVVTHDHGPHLIVYNAGNDTRYVYANEDPKIVTVEVLARPFAVGDKIRIKASPTATAEILAAYPGWIWVKRTDPFANAAPYTTAPNGWEHDPGA